MIRTQHARLSWIVFAALAVTTALVYRGGLAGGFVYDDASSIVDNASVHVEHLRLSEWWRAAVEFPSGAAPFRSLTMLTFALNHYLSGLDPYAYKLTNLAIHLLNGLLLFRLLCALLGLARHCDRNTSGDPRHDNDRIAAAVIAGLWLLLPINISAVLYVVQRLEALAATSTFLGLWWYCRARLRLWQGQGGKLSLCASLIVCAAAGALAKESAVMLPLYAAAIEACLPRGRSAVGQRQPVVFGLYAATLLAPFVLGMIWLWGRFHQWNLMADGMAWTVSRLLTEARVLIDYIAWTLTPALDSLTLYHDDIQRSQGLLAPPSTLLSLLALIALALVAFWQRKRRPLFALGIAWFFCGHVLTATVIPLVLAFEHRNYFPSAGLLLACANLFALETPLIGRRARLGLAIVAIAFYGATTWMRAQEWSDPQRLARSDALKRPQSPAAQFDLAQSYLAEAARSGKQEPAQAALAILERNRLLPGAGIQFEARIITLLGASGYPAPGAVWDGLVAKLQHNRLDNNAIHALSLLNHCFADGKCSSTQRDRLAQAYAAAIPQATAQVDFASVWAEYAWHVAGDHGLAEQILRDALAASPGSVDRMQALAIVLIHEGKLDEAATVLARIERHNRLGMEDGRLSRLRSALENARLVHTPEQESEKNP